MQTKKGAPPSVGGHPMYGTQTAQRRRRLQKDIRRKRGNEGEEGGGERGVKTSGRFGPNLPLQKQFLLPPPFLSAHNFVTVVAAAMVPLCGRDNARQWWCGGISHIFLYPCGRSYTFESDCIRRRRRVVPPLLSLLFLFMPPQ